MSRHLFVLSTFLLAFLPSLRGNAEAKWTVMIYFDGRGYGMIDNSICLMRQLRSIKPTPGVNVVVEMSMDQYAVGAMVPVMDNTGTCDSDGPSDIYQWNGVYRFHLDANGKFIPDEKRVDVDLTQKEELTDFLDATQRNFKASHYMLVIKNHGPAVALIASIWHFPPFLGMQSVQQLALFENAPSDGPGEQDFSDSILTTSDPEYELRYLLSVNVASAISRSFGQNKIDVLAFDSCFRSFLETSYDLRNSALYFVASEVDIINQERWHYPDWLNPLIMNPTLQAKDIAETLVHSQKKWYGQIPHATLTSIDLSQVDNMATIFAQIAIELKNAVPTRGQDWIKARPDNSDLFTPVNVDLLDYLRKVNDLPNVSSTLQSLIGQFRYLYAQSARTFPEAGPGTINGLAIYFPCDLGDHGLRIASYNYDDPKPIPFVHDHPEWSIFLRTLLAYPGLQLPPC